MAGAVTRNRKKRENNLNMKLNNIDPKTDNQRLAFREYQSGQNMFLHGSAGTGKTFISLYLALKSFFDGSFEKIYIVRSAVPTRDQGFLPGTIEEKEEVYKLPYSSIVNSICNMPNNKDPFSYLEKAGIINFTTTSYIRGITIDDSVVIVDECQNMTWHEYYSLMTRLGDNSRIIFCGDTKQDDFKNQKKKERSGVEDMLDVAYDMKEFSLVEFTTDDIVRSGLVKKFIEYCENNGL